MVEPLAYPLKSLGHVSVVECLPRLPWYGVLSMVFICNVLSPIPKNKGELKFWVVQRARQ